MAVSATNLLHSSSGTGATSYASGTVTPTANNLILATFSSRTAISTDPNQPTASGCGLTWVVVNSVVFDSTSSSRKRVTVFRALGASPSAGDITFDEAGQSQTDATWCVDQFSGIDTTGTNGSGAIVQSQVNKDETLTTNSLTVTLGAFSSTSNATFGGFTNDNNPGLTSVGSGFTILGDEETANRSNMVTEYRQDNDTTVDITWTNIGLMGGIAVEIKAATIAGATIVSTRMMRGLG